MTVQTFQKGKFYTLPIKDFREEGNNAFFIVDANNREYAIRMFDFQKLDKSVFEMKELPCMVKDIHGDNIVFVQNFAQMFSERYISGKTYPFIVNKEAYNPDTEFRYYDVRDYNGVPFRVKCEKDTYLVPNQRILCVVSRPTQNKMILILENTKKDNIVNCISPEELLKKSGIVERCQRFLLNSFATNPGFEEAKYYYKQGNPEWVIKAITAVVGVEQWPNLSFTNKELLLSCYHRICLYLLEDSDYLHQFTESDRDNYQTWIADRVSMSETYLECLALMSKNGCSEEIDLILGKIRNSGYIYHPHRRMRLLIAMFSLQPELLEEKIDVILDLLGERAKDWKVASFTDAFSSFLQFYVMSNKDKTNREAVIDNEQSNLLLKRMVRSICYLLLMTNGEGINFPMYRSLLYHYLSFVRGRNVLGNLNQTQNLAEELVDRAFTSLVVSEESGQDFTWGRDFSQIELFAYQMAAIKVKNTTFLTRSYEAQNVRFTVSADGITIAKSSSAAKEKNILPQDFPYWHNLQIFLDQPTKFNISKQSKMRTWKAYWNNVEQALFEEKKVVSKTKKRKISPEVGTVTTVRVLWKDENHQYRYYCRIEDDLYEGEGWIDTYQKGGSIGLFHYDPELDIDSFFIDGKPILFKVRVNAIGSPKDEKPTYTFDAVSLIDELIREQVEFAEESNCEIIFYDSKNDIYCGVTSYGYGIFLERTEEYADVQVGDTVKVRVTDSSRPNAIQGEICGAGTEEVNIKTAAEGVLHDYAYEQLYEETEEELEEEAMSVSEDLFELDYMKEIINIFDHKAVLETDNIRAYAFLSIAHILSKMIDDQAMMQYLEQRLHFLCILEDYGENGKVNDEELELLGNDNSDMVEKFPLLKQRLSEMRIVNCFGQQEKNPYLWSMVNDYESGHILSKLSRLMLSYNMAEGFGLQENQKNIITKIKSLLNVNVELPQIYSFGEENQLTEFKTSIVFPPNNNMREDIKQQTFNIMKVICGMVNSYGGTLYLGVNNTGTARGLAEDLEYFEGSKDKFDLYVRNQIRKTLGDLVNASVVIEHPEAGKHWIYAIKVAASKTPVILKLDNKFYLREGTSTYSIEMPELVKIMDQRDFSIYNTKVSELEEGDIMEVVEPEEEKKEQTINIKTKVLPDDMIGTSALRSNITENWVDGYGMDTSCYLRIQSLGDWCMLDDVEWEDGIITLAIHDDELEGSLIIVYEDGKVNRVPMSQLTDKSRGNFYKMYNHKKPIFVCPVRKDDALLTAYEDDHGKQFLRLDDVSNIEEGKMLSAGNTLTDVDFTKVFYCEIISKQYHDDLHRMHNLNRRSLGFQALTGYGLKEQEVMRKIGIEL